jgi:hypothetical protein
MIQRFLEPFNKMGGKETAKDSGSPVDTFGESELITPWTHMVAR